MVILKVSTEPIVNYTERIANVERKLDSFTLAYAKFSPFDPSPSLNSRLEVLY